MLRKIGMLAIAAALLAAVGLAGVWVYGQVAAPAAAQESQAESPYKAAETITVIGQATAHRAPDVAQISIGVETMAGTVGEAVSDNEAKMESILAALKAAGVAEKDIQTTNFSIQFERYPEPAYAIDKEGQEAKPQYRVSNMVNITVRDLDSVDEVLDAVVEAGANNIWGVTFSLDDPKEAQADARADAIADAKARAEALAGLGGVELGPVMSISEAFGGGVVGYAVAVERNAAGTGTISPGEVEIGYQVQVTYYIER